MKKNLHNIERWVRGLVGLALIGYGYTSSTAGSIWVRTP